MKLIPYGSKLNKAHMQKRAITNDIYCFCGTEAWVKSRSFILSKYVICLPPGDNPLHYHWPVAGCPVLVFDTGGITLMDIEKIAYCLLCANATVVRAVPLDSTLIIYRRNNV